MEAPIPWNAVSAGKDGGTTSVGREVTTSGGNVPPAFPTPPAVSITVDATAGVAAGADTAGVVDAVVGAGVGSATAGAAGVSGTDGAGIAGGASHRKSTSSSVKSFSK